MRYLFRPHHMLCTRFFEGHGYSEEFTLNMTNILNSIDNDTEIEIVKGKDDLCCHCPNYVNGDCKDHLKVDRYDLQTLNKLNLKYGDVINYSEFIKTYNPSLTIKEVCSDCNWYYICHNHK